MLRLAFTVALLAALAGGEAIAAGKKPAAPPPAAQPEADERDADDRALRGAPPAAPPAPYGYPPPAYAAPPPARYFVLTEKQKRCGVRNGCQIDSRAQCPPCW